MAAEVKWNTESLGQLSRDLSNQNEILKEKKEFLININKIVEQAWQGIAGRVFDSRMDIDAENLSKVITELDDLTRALDSVRNDCYDACEESIRSEITSLKSKI